MNGLINTLTRFDTAEENVVYSEMAHSFDFTVALKDVSWENLAACTAL